MKFNIGDHVSFINEKQEGIVIRTIGENRVIVEIEDGFELEVTPGELVKTMRMKAAQQPAKEPQQLIEFEQLSPSEFGADGQIIWSMVPAKSGAVLTGPVACYLINRTGFQVLYTCYMQHQRKWKGIGSGILEAGTLVKIYENNRTAYTDSSAFFVQGILYHEKNLEQNNYFKKECSILMPDLQSPVTHVKSSAAFAKNQVLFSDTPDLPVDLDVLKEKFSPSEVLSRKSPSKKPALDPGKYGILETEREVDLHIEELTNEPGGMTNGEMVQLQLRHFTSEMNEAIRKHIRKIIFIHGVGNGRLKSEIRKELQHYQGIKVRDADPSRYGRGATEVVFT
jgi:hypothetical protein